MALPWAERRQALYYTVGMVVLVLLLIAAWRLFFYHVPMCNDGVQNGDETGVDCGGSCSLICPDVAKVPTVLWSRSFQTAPGVYTAAAYIQNNNVSEGAGAKRVSYSFQLLDDKNILVVERDGVMDIPPQQTVPIVESNIQVGNRVPAKTFFSFGDEPMVWNKVPADSIQKLHIAQTSPYADSRLAVTVANDSFVDARNVTLVAVLFDTDGIARAAAKSVIAKVSRKSQESVIFTWPTAYDNIARAEVTILPSF